MAVLGQMCTSRVWAPVRLEDRDVLPGPYQVSCCRRCWAMAVLGQMCTSRVWAPVRLEDRDVLYAEVVELYDRCGGPQQVRLRRGGAVGLDVALNAVAFQYPTKHIQLVETYPAVARVVRVRPHRWAVCTADSARSRLACWPHPRRCSQYFVVAQSVAVPCGQNVSWGS